jgi:nucleotide-binding universal stress UspA family protein
MPETLSMYKHILIATDGSELSANAISAGLGLAKHLEARVTAVTVTEPWVPVSTEPVLAYPLADYERLARDSASRILSGVAEAARKADVACATVHVKDKYPAEGIIETAKALGCDLIVMASHGRRGLNRLLLGSETTRVLTHSTIPVLVCR